MRNKLLLMFISICIGALGVYGQGIGDRNRPSGRGNFRITGKIYLPDGSPAKDVSVNVSGTEFNTTSARSDIDGVFTVSGLSSGNYSVSVREKGYQSENEFLTIPRGASPGQSFTLVFYLRNPGEAGRS